MLLYNIFGDPLVRKLASINVQLTQLACEDGVGVQWADDTSAVVPEHLVATVIDTVVQYALDFGLDVSISQDCCAEPDLCPHAHLECERHSGDFPAPHSCT